MAYVDPTTIRLSGNFLLSDFMGCTSVYKYGMHNRFDSKDTGKLEEGKQLAESLDVICDALGPISVVYGFISPSLSRKIVTYQDPNKPSYHRWDKGAAADICVHDQVAYIAPIAVASQIDIYLTEFSRIITYAESEIICVATSIKEPDRQAFYENRYMGPNKKPKYIKYPVDDIRRNRQLAAVELPCDWRGQGWPSYHGGGKKQYEHIRLGKHVLLTDLLYIPEYVHKGKANPPANTDEFWYNARTAAQVIDAITNKIGRISIVRGYDRYGNDIASYRTGFTFEFVGHSFAWAQTAQDVVDELGCTAEWVRMKSGQERIRVTYSD